MNNTKKTQIAARIKAFKNTDFSDCPELTDEQLAQMRPSHYRKKSNCKLTKAQIAARIKAFENADLSDAQEKVIKNA